MTGAGPLREARLHLSEEGGRHLYLLADPASGRILRLEPKLARLMANVRARLTGRLIGTPPEEEVAAATVIGEFVRAMRADASGERKKKFNPLFMQIPLFDVGPWQRRLQGLAALTFSPFGAVWFGILAFISLWIHTATDGAMVSRIGDIFSLSALATFAMVAPITKMLHELGHVLAATRAGVRVRKAGVMMLGMYPLPFVDCSEADLLARRSGRIMISLGGLFADLSVAMVAFIAWHLVEDPNLRQVLSSLVVFNSINTVVFNMNPILKLDGYFALSDAAHRRNWHTESFVALKSVRGALAQFKFGAAGAGVASAPLRIGFALASTGWKIWIVAFVAWQVLPKFLGLGLFLVAWGFAAMFLTPLLSLAGSTATAKGQGIAATGQRKPGRGWLWLPLLAGFAALIAFIPRPYHITVPVELNLNGSYAVRVAEGGVLADLSDAADVSSGATLALLNAPGAESELALAQAERQFDLALADSAAGLDPLTAEGARQRAVTSTARVARLQQISESRAVRASDAGLFRPDPSLRRGAQIAPGRIVGHLLPHVGMAQLSGAFPEIWVEKLTEDLKGVTLRTSNAYEVLDPTADIQLENMAADTLEGVEITVSSASSATDLIGQPLAVRLQFGAEPLWQHALFRGRLLVLRFREAQQAAQGAATQ